MNTDVIKVRIYTAILLACLSIPFSASALKTDGTIQTCVTGRVVDEKNEGIPGASVSVKYGMYRDEVLGYTACDDDGGFRLSGIPAGDYCLIISSIGYETRIDNISITPDSTLTLGELQLKPDATELQTVVVEGRPFTVKMNPDGYSMDVEHLAPVTNDLFDLLGRLPRVTTIGDKLKVAGKQTVLVKINNVLQRVSGTQLTDLLKSFDSSLAKNVEVILNPSLRYDPDGSTAMIVVHMNSFFNQYMGGMVMAEGAKSPRYNFGWVGSGTLTLNRKKVYLSATPSYHDYGSSCEEETYDTFTDGTLLRHPTKYKRRNKSAIGNVTAQYQFKENSYFGGNVSYSYYDMLVTSGGIEEYDPLNALIPNTLNRTKTTGKPQRLTASAYLEHRLSGRATMWIDAFYTYSYGGNSSDNFRSVLQSDGSEYLNYLRTDNMIANLTGLSNDYSIKLDAGGKYKMEAGFSAHYSHTRQVYNYNQLVPAVEMTGDLVRHNEVKVNPYVSTSLAFPHGIRLRAGLRVPVTARELKLKDGTKNDKSYVNWLPQFTLSWQPGFSHLVSARINSSATPPSFGYLTTMEKRAGNVAILEGNPNLKSTYSYAYAIDYTYKGILNFSGNITQSFGEIDRIRFFDEETGIFVDRPENAQNSVAYTANASYYFDRLWWMLFQIAGNVGYSSYKSRITGIPLKGDGLIWGLSGFMNFYFDKPRNFSVSLSGYFNGKTNTAYHVADPMWGTRISFKASLLERRLTLGLSGSMTSRYKGYTKTDNYTLHFDNRFQYPTISLSISYRFNNVDKKEIERKLSSEESNRRL